MGLGRPLPSLALPAAALIAAAATACAPGGATAGTADGNLVYATGLEPDCLDPQVSGLEVTALIDRSIFDSLVGMTPDGRFHPWLAERWTVSEDGRTYTFHLRSGVRFHDGTPLDAAAVKATLDHAVDPATKSRYAASLVRSYASAEVVAPRVVKVRLRERDASFLQALSTAHLGIQPAARLRGNAEALCGTPVGSGPFRFAGWTRGKHVVLTRNPGYSWGPGYAGHRGPAPLERLTIAFVPESSVRLAAVTAGQADMVDGVPTTHADTVRSSGRTRLLRADMPGAVFGIFLNGTRGVLADERVRTALMRAVDIDRLVESVYSGEYSRAWSPLSPATTGYSRATEGSWPYDPALSDRLLDQAGWTGRDSAGYRTKNGERLALRWPYMSKLMQDRRDVLAQGVQAHAKRVGIAVDLVNEDGGAMARDVLQGTMDLYSTSLARAEPDILRYYFARDRTPPKGGGNFFRLSDPRLDRLLRDAAGTSDPAVRARHYAEVQERLLRKALVVPLYVPVRLVGAATEVRGVRFDAHAYPLFHEARKESGK